MEKKQYTIAVQGSKGGVGKSTISQHLSNKLKDSIVLSLDFYQEAADINKDETIDVMKKESLYDINTKDKKFIIIDCGGFDDERLHDLEVDLFIFPTRTGYRSMKTTVDSVQTLLVNSQSSKKKCVFIINEYRSIKHFDKNVASLEELLEQIPLESDSIEILGVPVSSAIETAEDTNSSLDDLMKHNKGIYKKVNSIFKQLASEVKKLVKQ